ncbi:MAG: sulfotransferase [Cyclobacteriaceae bacterium]
MSNVDFLCLGAPKSGTTSLHDLLIQHPDIFLPSEKDFHYFDDDKVYARGLDWYLDYFNSRTIEKIAGDVAANYLYADPARVVESLGKDLKFIIIMRHPADRAYSYYLHFKRRLSLHGTFEECISIDYQEPDSEVSYPYEPIVKWSKYNEYIRTFLQYFDKEQFLFLTFESFVQDQSKTLKEIEEFLSVDHFSGYQFASSNRAFKPKSKQVNALLYKRNPIKKVLRKMLPNFESRHRLKQFIIKLNSKKADDNEFKLSADLRMALTKAEFENSILDLKELTGLDLLEWKS